MSDPALPWKVEMGVGITWLPDGRWMYDEEDRNGNTVVHDPEYLKALIEARDHLQKLFAEDEKNRWKRFSLTLDRQEPFVYLDRIPGELAMKFIQSKIDQETPRFKPKVKPVHVCHRTMARRLRTCVSKVVADKIDRIINEESK